MKASWACLLAAALLCCGSCKSSVDQFTFERMIAIDYDGGPALFPVRQGDKTIEPDEHSYERQLDQIVSSIKRSGRKKILIFAFGGMNPLGETVERSGELAKAITASSDYYPVCVNWESNLLDAYLDHLLLVRRGVTSYTFGPATAPFFLAVDVTRAVARTPVNLAYQTYGTCYFGYGDRHVNGEFNEELRRNHVRAYIGHDNGSAWDRVLGRAAFTLGLPMRVVTTPVIDAGGKPAWDVMLLRPRRAFVKLQPPANSKDEIKLATAPPDGAMSLFMDRMMALYREDPGYEFTLVGHSMGPLLLNELLWRYDQLPYRDIVYLAPACSVGDTAKVLKPYLRKHPKSTFYNLCTHPNIDAQDMMRYAALPQGSVLVWIDDFLADPVSKEDHTLGQWRNAITLMPPLMRDVESQVVIKAFGVDDPATNSPDLERPAHHTDFSDPALRFWEPKFWQIPTSPKAGP